MQTIYQSDMWSFLLQKREELIHTANNSNMDREFEVAMGVIFNFIFTAVGNILKGILGGIKKLTKWITWGGLLLSCIGALTGYLLNAWIMNLDAPVYIRYLLYYVILCAPLIYLYVLGSVGSKKGMKYEKIMQDIGFVGKDKKAPVFCGINKDGKKQILSFKSNIPLQEWKSAKARLETALDCNILKMEYGSSKKIVKLTVLPADFEIPKMITWNDSYCSSQNGIIVIGQSALDNISFNLNRVPHALIAGETGSGKSVILRCILWQMIMQGSKVYMIDFKGGVEFGKQYERFGEVITERERALEVLTMLVQENEYRLRIFRDMQVKNLAEYNRKTKQTLCRIGVFSDELAEMLDKKGVSREQKQIYEAIEGKLSTLARLSRATGINLFLGVQRPDANVLTGQIKNNIPIRISGRFADKTASEIVLGNTDAVELPDIKGRFLYKVGNETIEFQSFFFDDETMLHDVFVETGNMLLEGESYNPRRQPEPTQKTKKPEDSKTVDKKQRRRLKTHKKFENKEPKITPTQEDYIMDDSDAYPLWAVEEELPFPPDDPPSDKDILGDLDFNFGEEDGA